MAELSSAGIVIAILAHLLHTLQRDMHQWKTANGTRHANA